MQIDDLTVDVLRVLALPNTAKSDYFGKWQQDRIFSFPDADTADGIEQPPECFALLAAKTFHRYRSLSEKDPAWEAIRNVWCVLEMALALRHTVDYYWNIDPEKSITGPFDDFWSVLRILSTNALTSKSRALERPKTTFAELLAYWEVKEVWRSTREDR